LSDSGSYVFDQPQAQNASIIAAEGARLAIPDHGVTVALAAALQETQLRNLSHGDRDSLGLFQQRPSQGWGTATQIMNPAYAASAFYGRLVAVPGWQALPVSDAAQLVQRSATPQAYAQWEPRARSLARALTGEVPAAFSCSFPRFDGAVPLPSALSKAAASQFGVQVLGTAVTSKVGWRAAAWAVAHAYRYHVGRVSFSGRTWSAKTGRWTSSPVLPSQLVEVTYCAALGDCR
jgi:hypothetical protein